MTDQAIFDGILHSLHDANPQETREWIASIDEVIDREGTDRARYLLLQVLNEARARHVGLPSLTTTDYVNTIPFDEEPEFPGDEHLERRIRAYIRWNAAVMVTRAQRPGVEVQGHMATYASAATLYECGFNHFFRGKGDEDNPQHGDQLYIQGHASPGIYARGFLEGRFTEEQLDLFRQETKRTSDDRRALSSYPHPRLMPDFWEFPTVSMGLSPITSIYQARFNRYLHNRGIVDTSNSHVWGFFGDGETGEPEMLGALGVAAREGLDNLTWVVNCNLQQLDGPVRGNGKIIQELEGIFRGAGWDVIKVIWGKRWDELLRADESGALVRKMNETPDGQFQTYIAASPQYIRDHFFDSPELADLIDKVGITEQDLPVLSRGGHDYPKVYAAYRRAMETKGHPTVILAHTIKGWTLGPDFEARNATHQMKKLVGEQLKRFRDRLYLDISDEELESDLPPYVHPGEDSDEVQYMLERRRELGGFAPRRLQRHVSLNLPEPKHYERVREASRKPVATTMAFVRQFKELLKHPDIGFRLVPIIPDEARTFGMDSLFPQQKIYSSVGQRYDPVDREMLLTYKEAKDGQILHEGITEVGSMGSFHAAGSCHATFGEPMIPCYFFYSMFGWQRTADLMWSAADQRCRGFLLGATAGRTTLNGEGLQHEDGHSILIAATNPGAVTYDCSFAYEIGAITQYGIERMYGEDAEDVFFYLTMYNEPIDQPAQPDGVTDADIIRGLYPFSVAENNRSHRAQILASGSAMPGALRAQELLAEEWDVAADVWSAPGWVGLQREGIACEEWNRLHPTEQPRVPYVTQALHEAEGPTVAVTDYMRAVPGLIARWVPGQFAILGTDGFGRSDTRPALRRYFHIDAENIVVSVLNELAARGDLKPETVAEAIKRYDIDPESTTEVP